MNTLPLELTPAVLASIAGILLSLSFNYIPGWNVKYGEMTSQMKSLIMLGCLLLTTGILFLLVKYGAIIPNQPANGWSYFWMFIFAVASNQATYNLSPATAEVKTAKAQRSPFDEYSDAG